MHPSDHDFGVVPSLHASAANNPSVLRNLGIWRTIRRMMLHIAALACTSVTIFLVMGQVLSR